MKVLQSLLCVATIAMSQSVSKLPLIAVMPLTPQGVDSASALVVTDALSDQLLRDGKVRVMERSQMEKILKEQGFTQSGMCDGTECALVIGKLLSIDRMVVGSLGKLGESFTLSVRVVDVGTGEILGSARRMRKGAIDDVISDLLPLVTKDLVFAKPQNQPKPIADQLAMPKPTPPPADLPRPEEPRSQKSGHAWAWWTAGGVVVAGGAVAAFLLTRESSTTPTTPDNQTPSPVTLDAKWK